MYSDDEPPVVLAKGAIFNEPGKPIAPVISIACDSSPKFFSSQPLVAEKKQVITSSKSLFSDLCIQEDLKTQQSLEMSLGPFITFFC